MKKISMLFALLSASAAQAAPFLVCDSYPANAIQPDSFVVKVSGLPDVTVPAVKDKNGLNYLRYDVAALSGQKTITVHAKNAWGISAASAPFTVTAGSPPIPAGITIIP
jgi:hypothetical protein